MKKLLLLLSIVLVSEANAQLTNAQVYNYEIGDIFQVAYVDQVGPNPFVTDSVMNKCYSSGLDTLYYVMSRTTVILSNNSTIDPLVNLSIDTVVITDLALPAEHFDYHSTCLPTTVSILTDDCGNTFERYQSNADPTCVLPPNWHSDLYPGLGGPYYQSYDPALAGTNDYSFSKHLTYYNSNQFGECGINYTVGIEELNTSVKVNVYPNPATNELHVSVKANEYSYSIFAPSGNLIETDGILGEEHTIDISQLSPGSYFIKVSTDASVKTLPFVKK